MDALFLGKSFLSNLLQQLGTTKVTYLFFVRKWKVLQTKFLRFYRVLSSLGANPSIGTWNSQHRYIIIQHYNSTVILVPTWHDHLYSRVLLRVNGQVF